MEEATPTQHYAGISRNTVLLAFTSLFADISTELLYPVLPIFLTQTLHASGSVVGLVEGIAQATQNVVHHSGGTKLCTTCVQEKCSEGPENGPKQRRINNRQARV